MQLYPMADPLHDAVKRGIPLTIIEVNSQRQQFEMVLRGRADIAPLTEVVGYHLLNQEGWKGGFGADGKTSE